MPEFVERSECVVVNTDSLVNGDLVGWADGAAQFLIEAVREPKLVELVDVVDNNPAEVLLAHLVVACEVVFSFESEDMLVVSKEGDALQDDVDQLQIERLG